MPIRPKRPCPGIGPRRGACSNLISSSERCCPECLPFLKATKRHHDKLRDESPDRKFIHSKTWRRIRDVKLSQDPLCERCLRKRRPLTTPAVLVHHKDGNEFNNDSSNHESLCNSCHEEIHRGERWKKKVGGGRSTSPGRREG